MKPRPRVDGWRPSVEAGWFMVSTGAALVMLGVSFWLVFSGDSARRGFGIMTFVWSGLLVAFWIACGIAWRSEVLLMRRLRSVSRADEDRP